MMNAADANLTFKYHLQFRVHTTALKVIKYRSLCLKNDNNEETLRTSTSSEASIFIVSTSDCSDNNVRGAWWEIRARTIVNE